MLFVHIDLGETEEVQLSKYTKDKIEYYSSKEGKSKGEFLSELIEEKMSKYRHPDKEIVHLSELPNYVYVEYEDVILIGGKGVTVNSVEESEECDDKYIVEYTYRDENTDDVFWVDCDDLIMGINEAESILCVPLVSETEVSLSKEEKEFIGVE